MKRNLQHREAYLILLGLAVVFVSIVWLVPAGVSPWAIGLFGVLLMGIITGWVYHRLQTRGKRMRAEAIREIQLMLKDQINSQLTVIESMSNLREIHQEEAHQARDYITKSVNTISTSLNEISEDSLLRWQRRYRVAPDHPILPLK